MKTFFIWMIAGLTVGMSLSAQGYGGRYGGRGGYGGGYRGNRANPAGVRHPWQRVSKDYNQFCIPDFREITELTLKQKLDLSTVVTDEHKNILKLMDQKQELQVKIDHADNQKNVDKYTAKMAKLDDKMKKVSTKADKKIQAILTKDQYKDFLEKKDLIKFGTLPTFRGGLTPDPNRPKNGNPER